MSALETSIGSRPRAESSGAVGKFHDCSGVGFWREVLDVVNLHSKFAVTRLKSSVECADQSLHNGWLSRDDAKATLAACANRFFTVPDCMWSATCLGSKA